MNELVLNGKNKNTFSKLPNLDKRLRGRLAVCSGKAVTAASQQYISVTMPFTVQNATVWSILTFAVRNRRCGIKRVKNCSNARVPWSVLESWQLWTTWCNKLLFTAFKSDNDKPIGRAQCPAAFRALIDVLVKR